MEVESPKPPSFIQAWTSHPDTMSLLNDPQLDI